MSDCPSAETAATDPVLLLFQEWQACCAALPPADDLRQEAAFDAALDHIAELEEALIHTPAVSIQGLRAKLHIVEENTREGIQLDREPDLDEAMILSAIADAYRLLPA